MTSSLENPVSLIATRLNRLLKNLGGFLGPMGAPILARFFCARVGFHGSVELGILHLLLHLILLFALDFAFGWRSGLPLR
ncbi:MAG: hypothetical protein WBP91_13120 [Terriglobales bacterium]